MIRSLFCRSLLAHSTIRHGSSLNLARKFADPAFRSKIAIIDEANNARLTYKDLNELSSRLASQISVAMNSQKSSVHKGSVAAFHKPGTYFVVAMLAAWKLGKVFVPLSTDHSRNELDYIVEDSCVDVVCCIAKNGINKEFSGNLKQPMVEMGPLLSSRLIDDEISVDGNSADGNQHIILEPYSSTNDANGALVIYTSGTTGRPKGVLHTHHTLYHMTVALVKAWEYEKADKILHFLPLYHVHGLVNKLLCVLYVGGTVEFLPSAGAAVIWQRLAEEEQLFLSSTAAGECDTASANAIANEYQPLTLFMAVPTIYARMLEYVARSNSSKVLVDGEKQQQEIARAVSALGRMRLMVCGSAALPDNILNNWEALTGYRLLERYGMTEIGMALSNPYRGQRKTGSVGLPLPNVECRLVDEEEHVITGYGEPGELRIKGPNVFDHYLNRKEATEESFDQYGWFCTGDLAERTEDGYYKILGRNSTDIIKSAGYKLSALEIERELLAHPQIAEAAVVGIADDTLGEKVVAVLALRDLQPVMQEKTEEELIETHNVQDVLNLYLKDKLARYKQPRKYLIVDEIPRNHMGKVNKKSLLSEIK